MTAARVPLPAAMTAPAVVKVLAALMADGTAVRFVGGCVRDALAGRRVGDVDLATADPPERVVALLGRAGLKAAPTGIDHGTVTAVADGRGFEVTTLRLDVRTFGRHAEVAFTDDWKADAARRDFTFNAMSLAPDGTLYDYFGGRRDLAAGRVRFVGEPAKRIAEDYLRVLRFFRFLAHFGRRAPAARALAACRDAAFELKRLSGERVRNELVKLLAAPDPVPALRLMATTGVLAVALPEAVDRLAGDRLAFDRLAGLVALDAADRDPVRRLTALIAGDAAALATRLKLSNAERDRLAFLVPGTPGLVADTTPAGLRRLLYRHGQGRVIDALYLAWADAGRDAAFAGRLDLARAWVRPEFPLKGRDLIAAGVPRGPAVSTLLKDLEAWWEAGDFRADRAACLTELRRRMPRNPA
ncbi:MAG: CCA tRNA nucleotidyltransferase [Alphaproteobacteria bacterium]